MNKYKYDKPSHVRPPTEGYSIFGDILSSVGRTGVLISFYTTLIVGVLVVLTLLSALVISLTGSSNFLELILKIISIFVASGTVEVVDISLLQSPLYASFLALSHVDRSKVFSRTSFDSINRTVAPLLTGKFKPLVDHIKAREGDISILPLPKILDRDRDIIVEGRLTVGEMIDKMTNAMSSDLENNRMIVSMGRNYPIAGSDARPDMTPNSKYSDMKSVMDRHLAEGFIIMDKDGSYRFHHDLRMPKKLNQLSFNGYYGTISDRGFTDLGLIRYANAIGSVAQLKKPMSANVLGNAKSESNKMFTVWRTEMHVDPLVKPGTIFSLGLTQILTSYYSRIAKILGVSQSHQTRLLKFFMSMDDLEFAILDILAFHWYVRETSVKGELVAPILKIAGPGYHSKFIPLLDKNLSSDLNVDSELSSWFKTVDGSNLPQFWKVPIKKKILHAAFMAW
jgi:hypothetical protein